MKIGILIAVLFAVAHTSKVDRCRLDGENACRDYSTASQCQTSNYCKAVVWNRPINSDTKMCQMCLDDIKNLQQFISAKTTRDFVKYDLLALCRALPFEEVRTECTKLVNDNFEKIYQEIVEKLNPSMICRALHICPSKSVEKELMDKIQSSLAVGSPHIALPISETEVCHTGRSCQSYSTAKKCGMLETCKTYVWSAPTKDDPLCDMCKQEFKQLQDLAKNPNTRSEIKTELLALCDEIPISTVQQDCHNIVDKDFDVIYDDIVAMLDPSTACSALGLCTAVYSDDTMQTTCELDGNNACLDYSTAAKCKTLNYCRAIIWSEPVQSNNLCDMCLADVSRLQKFISANSTREFVQSELLAICKLLPVQSLQFKCQTTVITNFEEIYNDIVSLLNPKTVCRALFICQSQGQKNVFSGLLSKIQKEGQVLGNAEECALDSTKACYDYQSAKKCDKLAECKASVWSGPVASDEVCEMCQEEVKKLQDWAKKGTTKAEIQKDLMAFCDKIPFTAFRDECKTLITSGFDMIYDDVIALLNPSTLCTAVRLCKAVSTEKYVKSMMEKLPGMLQKAMEEGKLPIAAPFRHMKSKVAPTSCSDCEAFVQDFQNKALNNKKVMDNWLNMLKSECQGLGGSLAPICEECVEMFIYSVVMRHQSNDDDPKTVCKSIMMCEAFTKKERSGDMCADCKTFFSDWQQELKNNPEAVDQIVHAVSAFYCLQKPEKLRDQCTRYVSMVIKVLLEEMERQDVGKICSKLELCEPSKHHDIKTLARKVSKLILQSMPKHEPKVGGEPCSDCKSFISDLQGVIQNNKSLVQELVDLVKQECDQLGPELSAVCKKSVDEAAPIIEDAITSNDPTTICTTIMMCSESVKRVGGDLCSDCTAFFGDWQTIITNNQSIINVLVGKMKRSACGDLPSSLKDQCNDFFDKESKEIIDDILANDPETVCSFLYFCDDYEEPKQLEGEPCPDCKNFMTDLQGVIQSNSTIVQDLVDLVKQECDQLGFGLSEICRAFVDDNYRTVLAQFAAEDVGTICSTIDMCGQSCRGQSSTGDLCTDCTAFFGDWQSIITNNQSIVTDVTGKLKKAICDGVPEILQGECYKLFDKDCGIIVQAIKNNDPEEVCATLYFCGDKRPSPIKAVKQPVETGNEMECQACQFLIEEVEKMVVDNKTEESIAKALENVCELYGEDIRDECKMFVEQYGADIIDFLLREMNSIDICTKLGLCEKAQKFHLTKTETKDEIPGLCEVCKEVMRYVDSLIDYNSTEKEVIDALDRACDALPGIRKDCLEFVNSYGKKIIDLILKEGTSPSLVCEALSLCSKPPKAVAVKVKGPIACEVCEEIMRYVDSQIDYQSTEKDIIAALDRACNVLPRVGTQCKKFVDTYGKFIVHLILKEGTSPLLVCEALQLCSQPPRTAVRLTQQVKPINDDIECDVCKALASELDTLINSSSTEHDIEKALLTVCDDLPSSVKDTCDKLVKEYGPDIVKLLMQELEPDVICKQLKLCTDEAVKVVGGEIECEFCDALFTELYKILDDSSTEKDILDGISGVCRYLGKEASVCDMIIHEFGPRLIQLITKELKPSEICAFIKACPKSEVKSIRDDIECDVCKALASELDTLINSSSTEHDIEKALLTVCDDLPSSFKDTCDELVKEYGPDIAKLLMQELEPDVICKQLKLCSDEADKNVAGDIECEFCMALITEVDKILDDDATEKEILDSIAAVCSYLGKEEEECNMIIHEYGPAVIQLIAQELNANEICAGIKACVKVTIQAPKDTLECDACTLVVQELDKKIDSNSTEAEVEKALDSVCEVIPENFKQSCLGLVVEFGPEIAQLLKDEMQPDVICVQLKLCAKNSVKVEPEVSASIACEACQAISEELDKKLSEKSTQDEIEAVLDKVCSFLPSEFKRTCDSLVQQYRQQIIDFLIKEFRPSSICVQLKLCPATSNEIIRDPNLDCEICTLIAQEVDKTLSKNSTQGEIESALYEVCNVLPSDFKTTCGSLIKKYGPDIAKFLVNEFSPSKICVQIKLCPQSTGNVIDAISDCDVCKWIAQGLDDLLKENATKAEIEAALDEVCDILPSSIHDSCVTLIAKYEDNIIALLVAEMQPKYICFDLHICTPSIKVKRVRSEVSCELCEFVMTELDTFLKQNSTKEELEKVLDKICAILPSSAKNECMTLIARYGGTIIDILREIGLTPREVCPKIGLCPASGNLRKVEGVRSVAECDICQVIIKELDVIISDESTEKEILNAVNKICDLVPKQDQATCHQYINDYGPGVIDILVHDINPGKVCDKLHACTKKAAMKALRKLHVTPANDECQTCKEIVTVIDRLLKNNYTIAALDLVLEKVCDEFPAAFKDECVQFVDEIGPMLAKYIDKIGDPAFVCQHVKLCPTDIKATKILGFDKCTYGPAYWCRDLDTARSCNAVTHCMNHVW